MSQPLYCSAPGEQHEADVLIGMVANGDQTPLCGAHLLDWCQMILDTAAEAEAAATAAEAEARLAGIHAPAPVTDEEQAIADAIGLNLSTEGPAFPATAKTVRKHTSKSRRAYDARQAARAARVAESAASEPIVAPGPSETGTDEADVATPPETEAEQ